MVPDRIMEIEKYIGSTWAGKKLRRVGPDFSIILFSTNENAETKNAKKTGFCTYLYIYISNQ